MLHTASPRYRTGPQCHILTSCRDIPTAPVRTELNPITIYPTIEHPELHDFASPATFLSTVTSSEPFPDPWLPRWAPELPAPEAGMPSRASPFSWSGGGAALEERSTPEPAACYAISASKR